MSISRRKALLHRDFTAGNMLPQLIAHLKRATQRGQQLVGVQHWADAVDANAANAGAQERGTDLSTLVVLRLDLDSDPDFADSVARLIEDLGGRCSFYYRLRTWRPGQARKLADRGHHVDYHYEELSTLAYADRLRSADAVRARMAQARENFAQNIGRLRQQSGLPMQLPSAHNEWIDRRLGYRSAELLDDSAFCQSLQIRAEADAPHLRTPFGARSVDALPAYLDPQDRLGQLMQAAQGPAQLIFHPRDWRSSPMLNLVELGRTVQERLRMRG